jgi:hypothetical protein
MPNPSIVPITQPRVPFLNPETGFVSIPWYRFLLSLNELTSGSDVSLGDLQKSPLQDVLLAQIAELEKQLEALALQTQPELGTMSSQNADNVDITGGSISGLNPPLPVASGGTGQSTFTNGQLLIGNTTGNTLTKATLTQGAGISITNAAGAITIATANGISGTAALAKLTPAGTNGSLTFVDGIITAYAAPT